MDIELEYTYSYRRWNCSPNDVLAKLKLPVQDLKKGRYQRYVKLLEIFLSRPKSHEWQWAKSAEKLSTSPFKSGLLIDTIFSHINLAV
jgi:hypothetical protein